MQKFLVLIFSHLQQGYVNIKRDYVTQFREPFLSASSEKTFLLFDRVTGGVFVVIVSSLLLRGESEGRKLGSIFSAALDSPAEGGMFAGGETSGLVGGDSGESPTRALSLANG
jgi:hypothetical protein